MGMLCMCGVSYSRELNFRRVLYRVLLLFAELCISYQHMCKNVVIINNIMTWTDLAAAAPTILTVLSIGAILIGVIRWLVKHYFDEIKNELKPNGGGSIKDQVTRLERRHDNLEEKVDKIYEWLATGQVKVKRKDTE